MMKFRPYSNQPAAGAQGKVFDAITGQIPLIGRNGRPHTSRTMSLMETAMRISIILAAVTVWKSRCRLGYYGHSGLDEGPTVLDRYFNRS